jgi:methylated-DNA-[protein]-cysteine S-methyltransferase
VTERGAGGLAWGTLASPVGELHVACSADGVAEVSFGARRDRPGQGHPRPPGAAGAEDVGAGAPARLAGTLRQLAEYFSGLRRDFDLPVDWSGVSETQRRVLSALLEAAGYGQTVTYGELARRAGLPGSGDSGEVQGAVPPGQHFPPARVVGQVMGANPNPVIVPCHRVVAGNGLGGYSGGTGIEIKRWLLIFEGALPPTLDWDPAGAGLSQLS